MHRKLTGTKARGSAENPAFRYPFEAVLPADLVNGFHHEPERPIFLSCRLRWDGKEALSYRKGGAYDRVRSPFVIAVLREAANVAA